MSPTPTQLRCQRPPGTSRLPALILAGAVLTCSGASAATFTPELKLEARYDDNVRASEHGDDDLVRVVAPGLRGTGSGLVWDWSVWARRSIVIYTDPTPTTTSDAASLRAGYNARNHSYVRAYSELQRSRNDLEPDPRSVYVPGRFRSGVGTVNLALTRLEASARLAAWDYSRPDQFDATAKGLRASLLPVRSRTYDWLLSYRGGELFVGGRRALTSHAALAGFRRRHSAHLGSRWEVGVAEIDDPGSPRLRRAAFTAGLSLYGRQGDEPIAEARVERDVVTTVVAEARRRVGNGVALATWRRELNAVGGYASRPVIDQRVLVSLADTLGRRMVVSTEGSYAWTQRYRVDGPRSHAVRAGVSFSRPVLRWATGRLGYDYLEQNDRDRPAPLHFRRSRISLSLTAFLP